MTDQRCLCGRDTPKREGSPVEVGDVLGHGIEPWLRTGRIVGQTKDGVPGMRWIVRAYRPGDGRWPTGGYYRQGVIWTWRHDHPVTDPDQVETFDNRGLFR